MDERPDQDEGSPLPRQAYGAARRSRYSLDAAVEQFVVALAGHTFSPHQLIDTVLELTGNPPRCAWITGAPLLFSSTAPPSSGSASGRVPFWKIGSSLWPWIAMNSLLAG